MPREITIEEILASMTETERDTYRRDGRNRMKTIRWKERKGV
jgi:hypothetical protein